jgi:hypothetical protein
VSSLNVISMNLLEGVRKTTKTISQDNLWVVVRSCMRCVLGRLRYIKNLLRECHHRFRVANSVITNEVLDTESRRYKNFILCGENSIV